MNPYLVSHIITTAIIQNSARNGPGLSLKDLFYCLGSIALVAGAFYLFTKFFLPQPVIFLF